MFNFNSRTDQFGFTQATIEFNEVFYYFDFLPTENRLCIVSDAWLNIDEPRKAKRHSWQQVTINY